MAEESVEDDLPGQTVYEALLAASDGENPNSEVATKTVPDADKEETDVRVGRDHNHPEVRGAALLARQRRRGGDLEVDSNVDEADAKETIRQATDQVQEVLATVERSAKKAGRYQAVRTALSKSKKHRGSKFSSIGGLMLNKDLNKNLMRLKSTNPCHM